MSAIAGLLSSLTGVDPNAGLLSDGDYGQSSMPNGMMALPQKQPRMIDRVHDWLRDKLSPSAPQGYEGLLSSDEIKGQRPGLLHSVANVFGHEEGGTSKEYQDRLDHLVKMKQVASQIGQQRAIQESRARIAASHPEKDGETPEQTIARLRSMFAAYISSGDTEMAGKVGEVVKALGGETGNKAPQEIALGGHKILRDPKTGAIIADYPMTPTPRDPNAPDTASLNREQKMFDRTNRLADDYRSESKDIAKAADGFRTMSAVVPAARAGSASAQIGLIYGFMHAQDPSSTVRETEYATAQNAAGVPERIRNQYNKLLDGGFLTPEQVDSFLATARSGAAGWKRRQDNLHTVYKQRAGRWKINPDDVLLDYFEGLDLRGSAAPSKADNVKGAIGGIR